MFSWFNFLKTKEDKYTDEFVEALKAEISYFQGKLKEALKPEWVNPYLWSNYTGEYDNINQLDIPANGFIVVNDPKIKRQALLLKGKDVKETADNVEKWLNKYITYTPDFKNILFNGEMELFIPANITYATRQGDCEDYALLFQSMLHICGYGPKSIVCIAKNVPNGLVKWIDGSIIGHGYNMVNIGSESVPEWVVYDANAGPDLKKKCVYPEMKDLTYFFNFWGCYTL